MPKPSRLTLATISYVLVLLLLFLFLRRSNSTEHAWMLMLVAVSALPAVGTILLLWKFWKPKRKYFFLFISSILVPPLLLIGTESFLDFFVTYFLTEAPHWKHAFWTNHIGLKHYINSVSGAILFSSYFSIPYFLSVTIVTETRLCFKKAFVVSLWVFWLAGTLVLYVIVIGSSLN